MVFQSLWNWVGFCLFVFVHLFHFVRINIIVFFFLFFTALTLSVHCVRSCVCACVWVRLSLYCVFNVIIVTCSWWTLSLPSWNALVFVRVSVSASTVNMCVRAEHDINIQCNVCMCKLPTSVCTISIASAVFNWHSTVKLTTHQIIWIKCIRFIVFSQFSFSHYRLYLHLPYTKLTHWFKRTAFSRTPFRFVLKRIECESIQITLLSEWVCMCTVWLHLPIHSISSIIWKHILNGMCILFCHMNCQVKKVNPASVFICKTCAGISVLSRIRSMWLFQFISGPNSESDRAAKDELNSECGLESSGGDSKISIAQTFYSLFNFSVLLSERENGLQCFVAAQLVWNVVNMLCELDCQAESCECHLLVLPHFCSHISFFPKVIAGNIVNEFRREIFPFTFNRVTISACMRFNHFQSNFLLSDSHIWEPHESHILHGT